MEKIIIKIKREPGCEDLPLPAYQTEGSSGLDLPAAVENKLIIHPREIQLVSTGFRISIPSGYEGQVRPRSGLALKHGIGILNTPGTIDSDYRGVVGVILFNFGKEPFTVQRGDRIAQLVIAKFETIRFQEVDQIDNSDRESGGFGSTGKK
jgi:dUTP pyrophosphatase